MGLAFSFDTQALLVPSDHKVYSIRVNYDTNNQIESATMTTGDGTGATPTIGTSAFADGPQNIPWGVDTTYYNPTSPFRSPKLDMLPWAQCSAAWINWGWTGTITEIVWRGTRQDNGLAHWEEVPSDSPPTDLKLLLQGVNWDDGKPSYFHLGEMQNGGITLDGYSQAVNATDLVNAYLNNRGHDGYHFIPSCPDFTLPPGVDATFDWLLALHKATYYRNIYWDQTCWVGTVKARYLAFNVPEGGNGVVQLPELELPSRVRVTYRPVAEGWR